MGVAVESRKIAAAILGLGQSLGLRTVAEGVETRNQAEMLLWLGCDEAQGWLYGRPVPASEVPAIVARETLLRDRLPDEEGVYESTMPRLETLPSQRLAHLQAIYDGVPVGLCFLDRGMRFLSVNRRLADINGRSEADHLGRSLREILPHRWDVLEPIMKRVLAGESIQGMEVPDTRDSSSLPERVFSMSYEPARDEAGEVVGISVALLDISEEKQAQALRKERNDMARRIEALEHELAALKAKASSIDLEFSKPPVDEHSTRRPR
jgi:PAS domain S-box-containing protein